MLFLNSINHKLLLLTNAQYRLQRIVKYQVNILTCRFMFLACCNSIKEVFGWRRRNIVKMTTLTDDPPVRYDVMILNNII